MSSGSSGVPPHDLPLIESSFVLCQAGSPESCEIKPPFPLSQTPISGVGPHIPAGCFPEYVIISTKSGGKKISDFSIGDSVISFDTDGNLQNDIVSKIFTHIDKDIYRYSFNDGTYLDVTKEHPVLIEKNSFEEIGKLKHGDFVINNENKKIQIIDIKFLFKGIVYNIEVDKNHTYIANNIRVHNKTSQEYYNSFKTNTKDLILTNSDPGEILPPKDNFPWNTKKDNPPGIPGTDNTRMPTYRLNPLVVSVERGVPYGTQFQSGINPYADSPVARNGNIVPKQILNTGGTRVVWTNAPAGYTAPTITGGTCFPYESKVMTPFGNQDIGSILVGQEIYSFDTYGNRMVSTVDVKMSHEELEEMTEVFEYRISNNLNLRATKNHSVLSKYKNDLVFNRLDQMQIGDILFTENMEEVNLIDYKLLEKSKVYHIVPKDGRLICVDGILVDTMAIILK
jgi:hypothetical protein